MKKIFFLLPLILLFYCKNRPKHKEINDLFLFNIQVLIQDVSRLELLVKSDSISTQIQKQFLNAHQNYKKVEMLSEYYFPVVSKAINGPALDEYEEDEGKTVPPEDVSQNC
ncbi:hypothetical protein ACFX5F_11235 [Flavobacterium sp. ZS1P70]|uniref:Uncharacterized protein n=1 Tax=Flavobacterium zhoui TaxID=3230414 RepID=A0ABW6I699_9FLAO